MHPFPYFNQAIALTDAERKIVDDFHCLYFKKLEQKSGLQLSWLGHLVGKLPSDLWRYQEIIYEYRPDLIIETGTYWGGSAIFFSTMLDLIGHGRVLSIDKYPKKPLPGHPRLDYLAGSSICPEILSVVEASCKRLNRVMVILDSDHHYDHVLSELQCYSRFVPPGGHLIVEDTFLGGNPSHEEFGIGPSPSIDEFLRINDDFYVEKCSERFLFTLNRNGYLRRKD